jgi:hypothetical protein
MTPTLIGYRVSRVTPRRDLPFMGVKDMYPESPGAFAPGQVRWARGATSVIRGQSGVRHDVVAHRHPNLKSVVTGSADMRLLGQRPRYQEGLPEGADSVSSPPLGAESSTGLGLLRDARQRLLLRGRLG